MKNTRLYCTHLTEDTGGSVAALYGLLLSVIMLFLVVSVDYGRKISVSRKMVVAIDAAALAGAKMLDNDQLTDADIINRANAYFEADMTNLGVGAVTVSPLATTVDRANQRVITQATANVQSLFGGAVGISTMLVDKSATVSFKVNTIELALALDVTGSMADVPTGDTKTKIQSLKTAATKLVTDLLSRAKSDQSIRIALAPYSGAVNIDKLAKATTNNALSSGCVVERSGANNATEAPPNGIDALTPMPGTGYCPAPTITPLTGKSDLAVLTGQISSFAPYGGTAGHIGIAWAWYMLSPQWTGVFGGSAGAAYGPNTVKSAVIMTDGLFNMSYLTGQLPGSAAATTESYQQFQALCANMKAQKINVYTILFGDVDPTAQANLQACASGANSFYLAANADQLDAAFSNISDKLNSLRVSN